MIFTVSPGSHPAPVSVTMHPGARAGGLHGACRRECHPDGIEDFGRSERRATRREAADEQNRPVLEQGGRVKRPRGRKMSGDWSEGVKGRIEELDASAAVTA